MKKLFLKKYLPKRLTDRSGFAALMSVIMAIVILTIIASNFWVESTQKQSGSVLTYTSANAYFLAEAGIRYAEYCLTSPSDANCPCFAVNGCASDAALGTVTMNKTFGDGRGSFTVTFDVSALPDVRMNSTGKFVEAERFISRLFCQGGTSCALQTNSYTTCTPIVFVNNASTSQAGQSGICNIAPLTPVTFTPDPTGCPNTNYPDFSAATHLDGSGNFTRTDFCNMSITGTTHAKLPSATPTLNVAKDFTVSNTSRLQINGTGKINIGGNFLMQNAGDIYLSTGANLTIKVNGNFNMKNSSAINKNGNPANAITFIIGTGTMENSIAYYGAIYGPTLDLGLVNNADIHGAIIANSISMSNNSTLTYDQYAGTNSPDYSICTGGGTGASCTGGSDPKFSWQ